MKTGTKVKHTRWTRLDNGIVIEPFDLSEVTDISSDHDNSGGLTRTGRSIQMVPVKWSNGKKGYYKKENIIKGSIMQVLADLKQDIEQAKKSSKFVVFLGGLCKDNSWRKEIDKELGEYFFFIDPFDPHWDSESVYTELAGIANSDCIVFYKPGENSENEQDFLKLIKKPYSIFDNLDDLKIYLTGLLRKIPEEGVKILHKTDWVSLRRLIKPEMGIKGYDYLHEDKCASQKVAILPFRVENGKRQFLLRHEVTPCWGFYPVVSSITGSVEADSNPIDTAVIELNEEAGYTIDKSELIKLGKCFNNKMTDSQFNLFACDVSEREVGEASGDGSELEAKAKCFWAPDVSSSEDPLAAILYVRLMKYLKNLISVVKLESAAKDIVKYSEMDDNLVIMRGLATIRGTKLPKNTATPEEKKQNIDTIRVELAKKQHEKIHNIDSYNELIKCQKMMFKII